MARSIVDDELDIVNLFRDALSRIKWLSIFTFTDPLSAFEHMRMNKSKYAVVISDLRMPGINGMELVYKIKKEKSFGKNVTHHCICGER